MQILKYMLGVMLVLLAASPSFAYKTLDELKFGAGQYCFILPKAITSVSGDCLADTMKSLKPGMWGVPGFDDETQVDIIGNSVCVDYRGKQNVGEAADNQSYFDKASNGGNCFCQMTGPETSSWMFGGTYKDCNNNCASNCATYIHDDDDKIRTNMFKTVDYGGGSGGVDYSWLYDTTGTGSRCFVGPNGKFTDSGCLTGTDKIITEPRQWAAVLDGTEHPQTLVTGTAWVSDVIDTDKYDVGYIPTDSRAIDEINHGYESYKSGDNPRGQYCYCKMETPAESSWVLYGYGEGYLDNCILSCAYATANRGGDTTGTSLTNAMFSTLKSAGGMSMTVTTRNYVDGLFGGKQARITQTGTNKLMTFGLVTGAAPGSRDIVSTLSGASPTAPTVPETGPIVAAINNKQNVVNGTANFVMTRTGTAGAMNSKPVYSATNNYTNALVTAQIINTAAAAAANSELTCTRHIDGAALTDANCLLWGINTTAPAGMDVSRFWVAEPAINGTSYCYRRLNGDSGANGTCGADTLSYLEADGNKSGKWGTVFPYGDISGISVCSTVSASTTGTIATDAQAETMDDEYSAQAGVGESALASGQTYYCWCKMENPTVSGSPWVYSGSHGSYCATYCASSCSSSAASNVTFRSALFGI